MIKPPTIDDIRAAAERIEGAIVHTPMLMSRTLSERIGAEVWLKFENLQFTSAYKERGALNKLLQLTDEERARGVITASAGNHAQAVAYHARRLGIPATIVMPATTPTVKVSQTEGHGARVILEGDMFDDAYDRARELELEQGLVFVHPFNDPMVIAGQGTLALEMLEVALGDQQDFVDETLEDRRGQVARPLDCYAFGERVAADGQRAALDRAFH